MSSRITNDYHKTEQRKKEQDERDRLQDQRDIKAGREPQRLVLKKQTEERLARERIEMMKVDKMSNMKLKITDQMDVAVHHDKQAMSKNHVTPKHVPSDLKGSPMDNSDIKQDYKRRNPRKTLLQRLNRNLRKKASRVRRRAVRIVNAVRKKPKEPETPENQKKTKKIVDMYESMC